MCRNWRARIHFVALRRSLDGLLPSPREAVGSEASEARSRGRGWGVAPRFLALFLAPNLPKLPHPPPPRARFARLHPPPPLPPGGGGGRRLAPPHLIAPPPPPGPG